ncbi:TonB-dependent receptor [Niabella beijingensis]|uniref:TonB-dependent receptor n=1 Tax=Niabella beijingensis TaxID=2872700 RepID=UPI001CBF529F|nr:TonB-dependent receptor [Niabella beijingensis]MBZ4192287.1 TonB-dependent receptor [Niabella beijingensis]
MNKKTKGRQLPTKLRPLLALCCIILAAPGLKAQSPEKVKLSIRFAEVTLDAAIRQLKEASPVNIAYDASKLRLSQWRISPKEFKQIALSEILHYLLQRADVAYKEVAGGIVLFEKNKPAVAPTPQKGPGKVSGKIVDEENGQPVSGVSIYIGNKGTISDIDGAFSISLPEGDYTATVSFVGYGSKVVNEIEVKNNTVSTLNLTLKREKGQLAGIVVRASAKKESVASLYARQKKAPGISDGISAEQIARTPDKNVGEVLKRISGLAAMDNKYIVVRGLSERYNSSSINGQIMPSTELNRKNFSFDIIPSNLVDQVIVYKTITPDQNAEFGGGNVNVETKAIPIADFFSFSAGISVNDQTTGKKFLSQELSSREYFGLPSKSRNLLGKLNWNNTTEIRNQTEWNGLSDGGSAYELKDPSRVSNNWLPYERKAHPSQNYQLALGRVIPLKQDQRLGIVASLSYRNTLQTQRVALNRAGFNDPKTGLVIDNDKSYGFTTNTGALLGVGYTSQQHKLSFQSMYLGLLNQQLIIGTGGDPNATEDLDMMSYNDLTTYTRLWQNQLKGEHAVGKAGIKLEWLGSYTLLDRHRPDNHQMLALTNTSGFFPSSEFTITSPMSSGINAGALRWWSRAYEKNYNWDFSMAVPFQFMLGKLAISNSFKTGYAGWSKDRLFYVLNTGSGTSTELYRPIDEVFSPQAPSFVFNISRFSDDFKRKALLHAGYAMLDTRIGSKLRLVWGLRGEYFNMNKVNQALDQLEKSINIDRGKEVGYYDLSMLKNREPSLNIFPSANLTYTLTPKMSVRLAYSKSIIRPDLREMAYMREYDFELGGIFESNIVKSSTLDNYDLRYEWYPGPGEIISASLFYKKIHYPMEIVEFDGVNKSYQIKNNKEARNKGFEIEVRKSFTFTGAPVLNGLTVYGNFTYLEAALTPMDISLNELSPDDPTKIIYIEKTGPDQKRPQQGASNHMYNTGLFYDAKAVSISVIYNHVGCRIFRPANIYSASLYEQPLNSLDGQIAYRFAKKRIELRLNVSNLLNNYSLIYTNHYSDGNGGTSLYPMNDIHRDPIHKEIRYDRDKDVIYYKLSPGRTFSFNITYHF